jgi:hypothetical protein
MNELIKSLPSGVKIATVFLLAVYALMCFMVPMVGIGLGVGIGTMLAIARIIHYLTYKI